MEENAIKIIAYANMISEIIDIVNSNNIKIVSFDVYDTLILRHCKSPHDIFVKMFKNASDLFPDYLDAEDWQTLRITTERQARKHRFELEGDYEVNLDEIYKKLPEAIDNRDELRELEIEEEIHDSYINIQIYETILELKKRNYIVVLTSDMYLRRDDMRKIIESCGVDISLFDSIFISCEYRKTKRLLGLYETILSTYNIRPDELLHIGDNTESDIASAKRLGINTFYYSIISESSIHFPALFLEGITPFECDHDFYSLRVISASTNEDFWFQFGAMILGPFFTCFAQWIVKEAANRKLYKIRPIMREGEFLCKLMSVAARENDLSIDIAPIYASRMAIFTSCFNNITSKEIINLFDTNNITLGEVFDVLKIREEIGTFDRFETKTVNQLKGIMLDDDSAYNIIREWLTRNDTIELIRKKNANSSRAAVSYFSSMGLDDDSMTVDVGWKGSIQNAIDKLLNENGIHKCPHHYLCVSRPATSYNLYPQTDIRGFLGNFGSEREMTGNGFVRIIELSLMSEIGTTVGYNHEEPAKPIVSDLRYPEWQVNAIKRIQEGIVSFQNFYYKYASSDLKDSRSAKNNAHKLYAIIERVMRYPSIDEARILGELLYDQNFGGSELSPIICPDEEKIIADMGIEKYYLYNYEEKVTWRSGLNVLSDSLINLKTMYLSKLSYKSYSRVLLIQKVVDEAENRNKRIILIGAGKNLRQFLGIFSAIGKYHLISKIWDNSVEKQGASYNGIVVEAPGRNTNDICLCTVENLGVEKVIYNQLKQLNGNNIEFWGIGIYA